MTPWLTDARIVEMALLLTAIEAAGVVLWHRARKRGVAPREFLPNLMSGVCLMVAVRVALGSGWSGWIPLLLLGSLIAHLFDLARRWR